MSESTPKYLIRDVQGNVYGPADEAMLRDWVQQGRIIQGMDIAPRETREWVEASQHPAIADLFARSEPSLGTTSTSSATSAPYSSTMQTPNTTQPPTSVQSPVTRREFPAHRPAGTVTLTPQYQSVPVYNGSSGPQINTLGLLGFIAGIFGLVVAMCPCGWVIGAPVGLVAVTLSSIGLHQYRLNPPRYTGSGMAMAGLVMGIITLLIAFAWIAFAVATHMAHP